MGTRYKYVKDHQWVFSHYSYKKQRGYIVKIKVEKCVTTRHKHRTRKTVVNRWKDELKVR